ncbi:MAG: hypothetical protein HDT43_00885 [Ruminococcaceae bacterium]|nr:hypothetical protein [Oscillospiraceae bacterium]
MCEYLIIYGVNDSFVIIEAKSFKGAIYGFAEYVGKAIEPIFKKALNAMDSLKESVELYNRITNYCEVIKKIYKIEAQLFPEPKDNVKGGESNV